MNPRLLSSYQYIFEDQLLKEIDIIGRYKIIPEGITMVDINDPITFMPLVLEGAVKVLNQDQEGNEFLLYYLEVGDSCSMTMTCCFGNKKSKIRAVTEKETEICMIPIHMMEEWLIKYKTWRKFVFDSYDMRLKEMLDAINTVVFNNMEERLYKYLKDRAMVLRSKHLDITHYQIANDLNTSRVVVSRLVKKLHLTGRISSSRNRITLTDIS